MSTIDDSHANKYTWQDHVMKYITANDVKEEFKDRCIHYHNEIETMKRTLSTQQYMKYIAQTAEMLHAPTWISCRHRPITYEYKPTAYEYVINMHVFDVAITAPMNLNIYFDINIASALIFKRFETKNALISFKQEIDRLSKSNISLFDLLNQTLYIHKTKYANIPFLRNKPTMKQIIQKYSIIHPIFKKLLKDDIVQTYPTKRDASCRKQRYT